MISKNASKRIQQLHQKKFRNKENAFIAETPKVVEEFLRSGFVVDMWYATEKYTVPAGLSIEPERITEKELNSISRLETANQTLAVFKMPAPFSNLSSSFILALDGVRDPGNLGTIIRLADWFNIDDVALSADCVDSFNPKVVQSTMGSLARVMPVEVDFDSFLSEYKANGYQVVITDMEGEKYSNFDWTKPTILVMGNEANGVRDTTESIADATVTIPKLRADGAESLNVAMATGILLAEATR